MATLRASDWYRLKRDYQMLEFHMTANVDSAPLDCTLCAGDRNLRENRLHDLIIEAWDCAFGSTRVSYLSGPITTGLPWITAVRRGIEANAAKSRAVQPNCAALGATASTIRKERGLVVLEPGSLNVRGWSQEDYLQLWERFIEKHADRIIFMPDWEYSIGCAIEFARAVTHDVRTETVSGSLITVEDAIALLSAAQDDLRRDDANGTLFELAERIGRVVVRLTAMLKPARVVTEELRKDASLDYLAANGMNVAQFASFSPAPDGPRQEYSRVAGLAPNALLGGLRAAIETLLRSSAENSVNVRSYEPFNPQSREFVYGITDADKAVAAVERLSAEGLHTIVNETVDVRDGGVSGVLMGNVLEFAPDDTPRCVEKPGTASLPRGWGRELLSTVYRFPVELAVPLASRLEFSVHPRPRGWQQTNILTWEFSEQAHVEAVPQLTWPNLFSRLIGDKTFGLLVAHHLGLPVPLTTVINRRVAPFSFGRRTGWAETWIRTAPLEQMPGKFTTHRGWMDPYALMYREDPEGTDICSVLSQEGIQPVYSGALIVGADGGLIIEGKAGEGETLMLGSSIPEELPRQVIDEVERLYGLAEAALGPVRIEWVYDGSRAWVVQLHRGATETDMVQLTRLDAEHWIEFDVAAGLEALRGAVSSLADGEGIMLKGRVGLTSHIADVLRKARVPARMSTG